MCRRRPLAGTPWPRCRAPRRCVGRPHSNNSFVDRPILISQRSTRISGARPGCICSQSWAGGGHERHARRRQRVRLFVLLSVSSSSRPSGCSTASLRTWSASAVTVALALEWATLPRQATPWWWRQRLSAVRGLRPLPAGPSTRALRSHRLASSTPPVPRARGHCGRHLWRHVDASRCRACATAGPASRSRPTPACFGQFPDVSARTRGA